MKLYSSRGFALALLVALAPVPSAVARSTAAWEKSMVTLEINRNRYDYLQPWSRQTETLQKMGVVVGPREILTTGDRLADLALIRVQRGGRGKWWPAKLEWVDYHVNAALVTVPEAAFWSGLEPVAMADPIPSSGSVQVLRWRNGKLEDRKAEINRFTVKKGMLTFVEHLHLELDSEINGLGWSEPVVVGSKLIGIASQQAGNTCSVLPTAFFKGILDARKRGGFKGLGYFDFIWGRVENPSTLRYLKLEGVPRGAMVINEASKPGHERVLNRHDIILRVDGFDIDSEGDYRDPDYGNLPLENLSNRRRWAGSKVPMTVWRDGKALEISYQVPKAEYSDDLVPDQVFDQPPEYLLAGGFLFQPLTGPFLTSWGPEWRQRVPFRLGYYDQDKPTAERPALVLLTAVLPDPFSIGYYDYRLLVVESVNGQKVFRLADLQAALAKPLNGFHLIEFGRGDPLKRIVVEASQMEAATKRVLERYGIEKDHLIGPPASSP